jgi:hypothetical protein
MQVTYSDSIGNTVNLSTIAARVLTTNLLNEDKFDAHFSNAIITVPYKVVQYLKKTILNEPKIGKARYLESCYMKWLKHITSQNYTDTFMKTIKGDTLIYSMCSFDYPLLSHCLNEGVRVVAGGCEVNMYEFDYVRKKFLLCGAKEKNLKNLILGKGTITPYTDIYSHIVKGKDFSIPNNNLHEITFATQDYVRFDEFNRIKKILNNLDNDAFKKYVWPDVIVVSFNSKCIWGKCRFCLYCVLDDMDFLGDLSEETIIEAMWETCQNTGINTIFFADDYFYFTKRRMRIMDELMKRGCVFFCQSGVRLLRDEEYVKKVCHYFESFSIGLEATVDFALEQMNKGFTWKDVEKTFEHLRKHCTSRNQVTINIIIDGPIDTRENANLNYQRLLDLKLSLEELNIRTIFTISVLQLANEEMFKRFEDLGYIRRPKEGIAGKMRLLEELRGYVDIHYDWLEKDGVPYERVDKYGKILDSDFEIVDEDIWQKLVDQRKYYELRSAYYGDV